MLKRQTLAGVALQVLYRAAVAEGVGVTGEASVPALAPVPGLRICTTPAPPVPST